MLTSNDPENFISPLEDKHSELADKLTVDKKPSKDIWDKLQAIAPIISGLLMFGMAGYFTWSYNQQQLRLQEIQTIEKFIPHLMSNEKSKKAAILAISSLTNTEFAARFASIFASPGTVSALKSIATTGTTTERTIATEALAKALDNIASRYSIENNLAQAEVAGKQALEAKEQALGPDNPEIPNNLDKLAELYKTQGKYAEAEKLIEQSLKLRERLYGADDFRVAETLKNLAELYKLEGKTSEAGTPPASNDNPDNTSTKDLDKSPG